MTEGKEFVCPNPDIWSKVYQDLLKAIEAKGLNIPMPPTPLILGGWRFSDDYDKNKTWKNTIEWAKTYRLDDLIPQLSEKDCYYVDQYIERVFVEWNTTPRNYLSKEDEIKYLNILTSSWNEIVGLHLSKITKPYKLTGKKKRRLIVKVLKGNECPWGNWNYLRNYNDRTKFTPFRSMVNQAISPHEVDHIDFEILEDKDFSTGD